MAADGNRVGAHMGQLHILKRRSTHGDSVPIELFHMYDDSRCMYVVIVQDCRKQDRNGQQPKKNKTNKRAKKIVFKICTKKNESGGNKRLIRFSHEQRWRQRL